MRDAEDDDSRRADRDERFLRSRRAAVAFVILVFAVTVVQVLTEPVVALTDASLEWPLPLPAAVVFSLLVLGCAAQSAALLFADRHPGLAVVATVAVFLVLAVGLGIPRWVNGMQLVIALALFLCATRVRVAAALGWFAGVVLASSVVLYLWALAIGTPVVIATGYVVSEVVGLAALGLGGTALGAWWAVQTRRAARARRRAAEIEQQVDRRVREGSERERARIAQDLHDVAGQHLAGLITLADAAMVLAERQPAQALSLIEDVRNEGRFAAASLAGALADLKSIGTEPSASAGDLLGADALVSYWSARGMTVNLSRTGDLDNLPAVVSTTCYRSLQEALTNAAKHAPGAQVDVMIQHLPGGLEVTVRNHLAHPAAEPLPGLGLGWGLAAVRDRVELLRGTLIAGADDGGWTVRISIPLESAEVVAK